MATEAFVYGPPGTGKTSDIQAAVSRIVEGGKYRPEDICLVSFTKAAAVELAAKVRRAPGGGQPIPWQNIGTLHSMAFNALNLRKEEVAESKEALKEWNQYQSGYTVTGAGSLTDLEGDAPVEAFAGEEGDKLLAEYHIARARLLPREEWPVKVKVFAQKWEDWKQSEGLYDFTDFIEEALNNVERFPCNPAIVYADEFQDFTRLEQNLIDSWSKPAELVVKVGDPDQCIYEFKGTDRTSMIRPDIPAKLKRYKTQSYRVPKAVHGLALNLRNKLSVREPVEYLPTEEEGQVIPFNTTFEAPNARALVELLEQNLIAGRSTMILASCSYMLQRVITILRDAGLPFSNKYRRKAGNWNPLNAGGTTAAARLLAFLRPDNKVWRDNARFWSLNDVKLFAEFLAANEAFNSKAKKLIDNFADYGDQDGEISFVVLQALFKPEALAAFVDLDVKYLWSAMIGSKRDSFYFPIKVIEREYSGMPPRYGASLLAEKQELITIGTGHSVKGGEADDVILFPDISVKAYQEWQKGGLARDAVLSLFYVMATRARSRLFICQPSSNLAVKLAYD